MDRIMRGGPWSFDNQLLLIEEVEERYDYG